MIPERFALLLIKQKEIITKDLKNSNFDILEVSMSQTSFTVPKTKNGLVKFSSNIEIVVEY